MVDKDNIPELISRIVTDSRKRDFYELYFLLNNNSISEVLDFYSMKFEKNNQLQLLKNLTYFDDADEDREPELDTTVEWSIVKKTITDAVKSIL